MQLRDFRVWQEILIATTLALYSRLVPFVPHRARFKLTLSALGPAVGVSVCGAANAQPAAQTPTTVSVVHPEKTEPTELQIPNESGELLHGAGSVVTVVSPAPTNNKRT